MNRPCCQDDNYNQGRGCAHRQAAPEKRAEKELTTPTNPPDGWHLVRMPNGALIIESPARTGCLVTEKDEHPHSRMLWRLLQTMAPNRAPAE